MAPESFPHPSEGGNVSWKTVFSSEKTATDTFTVGVAMCPPGSNSSSVDSEPGHLKLHRHTHPELYHITSGTGIVTVDGREYVIGKGSVVFIPGDAEHGVRNTGEADLVWLYVLAAEGFGEVVYRFSGRERAKL
jgi:mannose-6-phosphate isomerase-like protein (cupin superfamily)